MTGYALNLAHPENLDDCLAEPLLSLLQSSPWVAYLTFGELYLSDVNDDPNLEEEYEAGITLWTVCVQTIFEAFCRRLSSGIAVRISLPKRSGLAGLVNHLSSRVAEDKWTVQSSPLIDPELVLSMSTYGWETTMWTVLPNDADEALSRGSITMSDLNRLICGGNMLWWLSHGYKEPFLTGNTPSLTIAAVADLMQKDIVIPVQFTEDPFVPHRVRLHRRWTADG